MMRFKAVYSYDVLYTCHLQYQEAKVQVQINNNNMSKTTRRYYCAYHNHLRRSAVFKIDAPVMFDY